MEKPAAVESYLQETLEGITVYYAPAVQTRPDYACITVTLKKKLFFRWIELEGARSVTAYEEA